MTTFSASEGPVLVTVIVYVVFSPIVSGSVASVLLTTRSSEGASTAVLNDAASFAGSDPSGSVVVVVTVTSCAREVPRVPVVGFTWMVTVAWPRALTAPRLHVTVRLALVVTAPLAGVRPQLPADGCAETKTTSSGRTLVMLTSAARLSPVPFRAVTT
jgi:hypothetical protein